jgi:hypothetical protein
MGLDAAIDALATERAWDLPAAGTSLRARAVDGPLHDLAGHVVAVGRDADTGHHLP